MSYIVVDVESDGPYPESMTGYSMVCFGAVVVDYELNKTFYGRTRPISSHWIQEALAISGITREQHMKFEDPPETMLRFASWIKDNSKGHPIFISDNPAYDWQFINYYFHKFYGRNPFGYSARRIGDIYCGLMKDSRSPWKHLRKTKHTHHPVDDAMGNAEALLEIEKMGVKFNF